MGRKQGERVQRLTRASVDPKMRGALQGVDDRLLPVLPGPVHVCGVEKQHRGSLGEAETRDEMGIHSLTRLVSAVLSPHTIPAGHLAKVSPLLPAQYSQTPGPHGYETLPGLAFTSPKSHHPPHSRWKATRSVLRAWRRSRGTFRTCHDVLHDGYNVGGLAERGRVVVFILKQREGREAGWEKGKTVK